MIDLIKHRLILRGRVGDRETDLDPPRFEKMREGIVDFEKVRILRELTAQSGNAQAQGLLKQLDQHLSIFPKEKEFDESKISADVRKGNLIIRQLSDLLAK